MDYTDKCRTNEKSGIEIMQGGKSTSAAEKDADASYLQGLNQGNSEYV